MKNLVFNELEEFVEQLINSTSSSRTNLMLSSDEELFFNSDKNIFLPENNYTEDKIDSFILADSNQLLSLDNSAEEEWGKFADQYSNFGITKDVLGSEYDFLYCDETLDITFYYPL